MSRVHHDGAQERQGGPPRRTVAIIPGSARLRHGELLRALEEAYPVSFAGSSRSEIDAADAVIAFPGECPDRLRVPCLVLEGSGPERERGSSFTVELSRSAGLDRALHGQRLLERDARPPAPLENGTGSRVLATVAGKPIWVRSDAEGVHRETASALPVELEDREFLRDHLTAGRFWSLLPIVQFLKNLSCGVSAQSHIRPACFVIDDPNVRFSSYGYVSFPELARDARECNYHVAVATIPLDLVAPGHGAVGVFRSFRPELSLVVHGNDHVHRELERCRKVEEPSDGRVRGGSRGTIRTPKRNPHRSSDVPAARRLQPRDARGALRVRIPRTRGVTPVSMGWIRRSAPVAARRVAAGPTRWRRPPRDPALLDERESRRPGVRAFLGQPGLILYLHHADLCDGLEPLRAAARRVAELGDARWDVARIHRGRECSVPRARRSRDRDAVCP